MDPTACLNEFLAALADRDDEEAADRAHALLHWLSRGGFAPDWTDTGRRTFYLYCAAALERD